MAPVGPIAATSAPPVALMVVGKLSPMKNSSAA